MPGLDETQYHDLSDLGIIRDTERTPTSSSEDPSRIDRIAIYTSSLVARDFRREQGSTLVGQIGAAEKAVETVLSIAVNSNLLDEQTLRILEDRLKVEVDRGVSHAA